MTVYPRHPIPTWLWLTIIILLMTAWLSCCHGADVIEVPQWVLVGIARVESSSYYRAGRLVYVDRRDGDAGEVGPWQLRRSALKDVGLLAHRAEIRRDPAFAEYAAILFLRRCYRHAGTWPRAIALYHTGSLADDAEGFDYFRAVSLAADTIY